MAESALSLATAAGGEEGDVIATNGQKRERMLEKMPILKEDARHRRFLLAASTPIPTI